MTLANHVKKQKAAKQPPAAPNVIITALAGTGKTTTLVEGLKHMKGLPTSIEPSPQQAVVWDYLKMSSNAQTVCFVAFNKSIASELQRRVPEGCMAMTMHSMGLKAVTAGCGRLKVDDKGEKVRNIIAAQLECDLRDLWEKMEMVNATEKLVSLCKMNLAGLDGEVTEQELEQISSHYDVELNGSRDQVFDLVPKVLADCRNLRKYPSMDFNDMIWLPVVLNLLINQYDLLLVDECQDLNRCQQALAMKAGRRLVLCGDVNQAIYGFAGADAESMARMQTELEATDRGCVVLPLTVTRRCGKAIVAEAQKIVPAFEAHESNGQGHVTRATFKGETAYNNYVKDGDMCLCRVTAPLVSQCFRFIKAGRKANIQGRDIGQGLISTVNKLKAKTVADLVERLSNWLHAEEEKENLKRMPSDNRLIALRDRHDCILCFTEEAVSIDDVIRKIESIFTDSQTTGIKLSTIHKAKGLEAHRVFLLEPEGATLPHPMAKTAWQKGQEMNLRYVAITRAIDELIFVK